MFLGKIDGVSSFLWVGFSNGEFTWDCSKAKTCSLVICDGSRLGDIKAWDNWGWLSVDLLLDLFLSLSWPLISIMLLIFSFSLWDDWWDDFSSGLLILYLLSSTQSAASVLSTLSTLSAKSRSSSLSSLSESNWSGLDVLAYLPCRSSFIKSSRLYLKLSIMF